MTSDEIILVTGATGTVGLEVVKILSKGGASIRAGSPSAQRSEDLRKLKNVETVALDYHDHSSMVKAIEGVQKIFLVTPGFDMPEVTGRLVEIVKKQEIRHIVKLSVMGAESTGGRSTIGGRLHRAAENIIEESGIPFSFLRPNYFMQNFVTFHGKSIREQSMFFLPWRDSKTSFIDTRDIAVVAAKILIKDDDDSNYKNKAYTLTGPEALSCFEVAEILSQTVGRKVNYVDVPEEHARQGMKAAGMPDPLIDALFDLYRITRMGHANEITTAVEEITPKEPTSFAQFANDYLDAWK